MAILVHFFFQRCIMVRPVLRMASAAKQNQKYWIYGNIICLYLLVGFYSIYMDNHKTQSPVLKIKCSWLIQKCLGETLLRLPIWAASPMAKTKLQTAVQKYRSDIECCAFNAHNQNIRLICQCHICFMVIHKMRDNVK